MKKMKKIVGVILGMALIFGQAIPAMASGLPVEAGLKNGTKTYKAGEKTELVVVIQNTGKEKIENLIIEPKYSNKAVEWPFQEIDSVAHRKTITALEGNQSVEVAFKGLTVRNDVADGRSQITFKISTDTQSKEVMIYPFTQAEPKPEKPNTAQPKPEPVAEKPEQSVVQGDVQEISGATFSGGGGGDAGSASVPRVIVTGFSTEPKEVPAGSDFRLIVHLKNTSKRTKVQNMEFNFSAPVEGNDGGGSPAFLPKSGSNTVYLESIAANGTADVAIELNAKSGLIQKPYGIDLSMKYEDGSATQFESTSSISIPIKQDARFEFSDIELSSTEVMVGDEINVMSNLYNMGRIKLYNVKVAFVGNSIASKEIYLGNIESGAITVIDGMITGEKPSTGEENVKMLVTYEDESGQIHSREKEFKISVLEEMEEIIEEEFFMEEQSNGGIPFGILVGAPLVLIAIVVVVVIVIKKRRRNIEGDGLEDELDRLIEIE